MTRLVGPQHAAAVTQSVNTGLSWLVRTVGRISVLDWLLIGVAVLCVLWGWVWSAAFARLGSITIDDLVGGGDDTSTAPNQIKAQLQEELGARGRPPPSGVPGGSPTKANISAALAAAPVSQGPWLAAIVDILPMPPVSTSFALSGTLCSDDAEGGHEVGIIYQLVCDGPKRSVDLKKTSGATWTEVVDVTAREIYRLIGKAAPGIYPDWAQWKSLDALTFFGRAAKEEQADQACTCGNSHAQTSRIDTAYATSTGKQVSTIQTTCSPDFGPPTVSRAARVSYNTVRGRPGAWTHSRHTLGSRA